MESKAAQRCLSLHLQALLFAWSKLVSCRCKVEQQYFLIKGIDRRLKVRGKESSIHFISFQQKQKHSTFDL